MIGVLLGGVLSGQNLFKRIESDQFLLYSPLVRLANLFKRIESFAVSAFFFEASRRESL